MTENQIAKSLQNGESIQIIFYENNDETNRRIKYAVDTALHYYEKTDIGDVIYGCVKELVINATRANLKRAFFQVNGWDMGNLGQYVTGITRLKALIADRKYTQYNEALRDQDLWAMVSIEHSNDAIVIEIVNNSDINPIEDNRIRKKLNIAMNYIDLATFYEREKDETEGQGMGIAIIVILLRTAGIDPSLFRIFSREGMTVSRIEIPLNVKYTPRRKDK